tara:strand:+ start:8717 stop:9502 length:786 start_codon:yes stop_codon:yes gene_type:complete
MALTNDQLRTIAPSIFATAPALHVSEDYQFVNTAEVIEILGKYGWIPIFAKQQKTRDVNRRELTKHTILLRHAELASTHNKLGGLLPTVRLVNSHDWACRLQVLYGLLRIICSNGMFAAGANFEAYQVKHNEVSEDLESILSRFQSAKSKMFSIAEKWAEITLTERQAFELADIAASIRFGEKATEQQALALLECRRDVDDHDTLWHTFNRIQENATKGGPKANGRKIRAITNIATEQTVNETLFAQTSKFADNVLQVSFG